MSDRPKGGAPAVLVRRHLVLLALALVPAAALAGDRVVVPGGTESLRRVLELGPGRPGSDLFLDVNRAFLEDAGPREGWEKSERRRALVRFVDDLAAWRTGPGCPALLSARGERWKATRRALSWLGWEVSGDGPGFEVRPRSDEESRRRRLFLDRLGSPSTEVLRRLSDGEDVEVPCADGEVEMPFGLAAWRETLGVGEKELNAGNALLTFARNVGASRMMGALQSVDDTTREELRALAGPAGGHGGWRLLYDEALDGFARFPEALSLRGGRVLLPGGPEADVAWAGVVGVPPSDVARFVVKLLSAESGKAAYVVDALRQLPPADARAFVLGPARGGAESIERLGRLYEAVERSGRSFEAPRRNLYDFAHLVRFLRFDAEGRILLPGGVAAFAEAIDGSGFPEGEAELARLLDRAGARAAAPEEVLQRLFRQGAPAAAADGSAQRRFVVVSALVESRPVLAEAGTVVLLVRGLDRLGASYAPLEELPLDDPALVRRYLFAANRLDTSGTGYEARLRAGLFQASVDLLATLSRAGSLQGARPSELLRGLLDVPLLAEAKVAPREGIAAFDAWLKGGLLAALRETETPFVERARREAEARDREGELPRPAGTPDELLAAALEGWRPPVSFSWRGGRYRWDATADGAARRRAFAATQQHVSLAALDASIAAREAALRAAREGDAPAMRDAVSTLLDALAAGRPPAPHEDALQVWVAADARLALGELASATAADALARLEERLPRFDALRADRTLEALLVHVYSSSAGDPAGLAYADGLLARRHDLSWGAPTGEGVTSPFGPTRLARRGEGQGIRIGGAFPGLADVLGLLHAEELVYDSRAYLANEQVRSGLVAAAVPVSPARLDADALRFVAASCRATEEHAAALAALPGGERLDAWLSLAGDLVPPLRLNPLASGGPDAVRTLLSPSDLYRIGRRLASRPGAAEPAAAEARAARAALVARLGPAGASSRLAELGPRPRSWSGLSRPADVDLPSYERLATYRRPHLFADRLYDLKVSAARAVSEAGDPPGVLPLLLATALDDLLSVARMGSAFDWRPLAETDEALARSSRDGAVEKALDEGRITREEDDGP